jgi:TolB protein
VSKKAGASFLRFLGLSTAACLLILASPLVSPAEGKLFIDLTSPMVRKVPIAVFDLQGASGGQISEIIRADLLFTGLFSPVDKASFIEQQAQAFNPANWTPLGIEAVVKGDATEGETLLVNVTLYDTFEGRAAFQKQYQARKTLLRQLAHSVSNDIYEALTGKAGIFRTKIAFVGQNAKEKDLYVMDWDGHRINKLGLPGTLVLTPHWSNDGTKMVYAAERNRQWGIYLLDFLKMTEKRIFVSKGTNLAGDFFPGGDAVVFSSSREGTPDLYVLDFKANSLKKLTSSRGIEVSPAVSPDGQRIAFVSDRGGSPQIYVMRTDGTEIRRVTFSGSYNTSPSWSPRGDRIVFSSRQGGKNQIFIIRPDGTEPMQLTERGNNEDPSFSPDGRYITFSSDRDRTRGVYVMRANGESQTRISPKDMTAYGPRWAPD